MAITFLDPKEVEELRAKYVTNGGNCDPRPTEMWDGVEVVAPFANTEHYRIASWLNTAFSAVIDWDRGQQSAPGGNVSDSDTGWEHNYRGPDVLVVLSPKSAVDRGTHWFGGPDLVVEIISPGEKPDAKFDFYAKVKTREVLIVNRKPWLLELYRLRGKKYVLAGTSELPTSAVLTSRVLPLTFQLIPGKKRPTIEVVHPATGRKWEA